MATHDGKRWALGSLGWGGVLAMVAVAGCTESRADLGDSGSGDSGSSGGTAAVTPAPAVYAPSAPTFPSASAGTAPFKLVRGGLEALDLWSQGDRIGWGRWLGASQSCSVQNCAATVKSVAAPLQYSATNTLHFPTEGWPDQYRVNIAEPGLSTAGATQGSLVAFDAEFAYTFDRASGNFILRCRTADCDASLVRMPLRPPVRAEPDFTYFSGERILLDDTYVYATNQKEIARINKAGPFVDQGGDYVEYESLIPQREYISGVTLLGEKLYWNEPLQGGSVRACPKTGCAGDPETVAVAAAATAGWIEAFVLDGESIYLLQVSDPEWTMASILRCPIADCANPTVLLESADLSDSSLLILGDLVFFTGHEGGYGGINYIGAIPK